MLSQILIYDIRENLVPIKRMVSEKFVNCILPSERKEDIRGLISIRVCIYRLMQLMGVELAGDAANQMMEDPYQG